jgi:hypothetical protein
LEMSGPPFLMLPVCVSSVLLLIKRNGSFDGRLVAHGFEALAPLLELVGLVDDALDLYLTAVQVVNCSREHVGLGEGSEDGDLVTD